MYGLDDIVIFGGFDFGSGFGLGFVANGLQVGSFVNDGFANSGFVNDGFVNDFVLCFITGFVNDFVNGFVTGLIVVSNSPGFCSPRSKGSATLGVS